LYQRFFANNVFIINAGRIAVITREETLYAEKPRLTLDDNSVRFYIDEPFISMPGVDYEFEEFPEKIMVPAGETRTRTRVGVLRLKPVDMLKAFYADEVPPYKVLAYLDLHLDDMRNDSVSMAVYLQLSHVLGKMDNYLKRLEKGLSFRPVAVEWHRAYQEAKRTDGDLEALTARYDGMLGKEPENASLLYLRGRIDPDKRKAVEYFDKAIKADGKNAYPYFAKAYFSACRGDFTSARELSARAVELNPGSYQMKEMYYNMRFATRQYDELEKEIRPEFVRSPMDTDYFRQLVEVLFAKGDDKGIQNALKKYRETVQKDAPGDPYQFAINARMIPAYLRGDFDSYASDAAALKDEDSRVELLKIAYLNRGEMEKLEELPIMKVTIDGYNCLLFWLGWLEKDNPEKAEPWLKLAKERFLASTDDENKVGKWLERPAGKIAPELLELAVLPEYKRILYAAFIRLFPKERRALQAGAKKMNFSLTYPHHFISKIIK
jgi:tetratricopeptide (TPR) repeat protein